MLGLCFVFSTVSIHNSCSASVMLNITSPNPRKSLELLAQMTSTRDLRSQSKGGYFTTSLKQAQRTAAAPPPLSSPIQMYLRCSLPISSSLSPENFSCVSFGLLNCSLGFLSSLCWIASWFHAWRAFGVWRSVFVIWPLHWGSICLPESGTQVRCVLWVSGKGENTGAQADPWQLWFIQQRCLCDFSKSSRGPQLLVIRATKKAGNFSVWRKYM